MNPKVKKIVGTAVANVRNGSADDKDRVIVMLLEHNKKFKERITVLEQQLKDGCTEDIPVYQQKPWYLED